MLGRGRHRRSPSRYHRSEFQHPTPNGFIRDVEPPLDEEFLDVPIAQREAQVEPDGMLHDHRRKAVATVGDFSHRARLPLALLPRHQVILTKPLAHVAPLGWEHIALTGDYIWNGSNPSTDFRPLRDVHTAFLPQIA